MTGHIGTILAQPKFETFVIEPGPFILIEKTNKHNNEDPLTLRKHTNLTKSSIYNQNVRNLDSPTLLPNQMQFQLKPI